MIHVPYLNADAERVERVERWRPRVHELPGFKIGVVWQGSPTLHGDSQRSMALARFAALAAVPGVTLVSLQKGAGVEQIAEQRDTVPLTTFDDVVAALQQILDALSPISGG